MPLAPTSFLYAHDAAAAVVTLTLNRPERLNALTFQVYEELRDTFRALDTADGVRAVVITGTGRAFCSGGDVEDIIGRLFERDAHGLLAFTRLTCDLILAIRQCRRPVVAALERHGSGRGGGDRYGVRFPHRGRSQPRSPSCSPGSDCRGPTWARPGCCPVSWDWVTPPSC